ncbi:MAG: cadherin-like domain-containing protein [Zoogloea sp.]|nr:cadherin-like domain-containing protein [Zoogloea sp.]
MSITVTGTNDGPTAVADLASTLEDQPVTFTVLGNDTDPDGDTLSVTGATVDPLKGTVVVNANGTLTFTPAPDVNGPVESHLHHQRRQGRARPAIRHDQRHPDRRHRRARQRNRHRQGRHPGPDHRLRHPQHRRPGCR